MSYSLSWIVQDAAGVGVAGVDVKLYRQSDNALLGTFTDLGGGEYLLAGLTEFGTGNIKDEGGLMPHPVNRPGGHPEHP